MRFPTEKMTSPPLATDGARRLSQGGLPGLGRPTPSIASSPGLTPSASKLAPAALQAGGPTPDHLYELGLTQAAMGCRAAAIAVLRDCATREPRHAGAWRKLAQLLRLAARDEEARAAEAAADRAAPAGIGRGPVATDLSPGRLDKAERKLRDMLRGKAGDPAMEVLRSRLVDDPRDVVAMRLLAQLESQAGDTTTAWDLLERALDICPTYVGAREDYAGSLMLNQGRINVFAIQTGLLIDHAPRNARYRTMRAYALIWTNKLAAAADMLAGLLREHPRNVRDWHIYGRVLHSLGRREESEQAYRVCLELQPDLGEVYAGLADLKGEYLRDGDLGAIRVHLAAGALEPASRMYMLYTMGFALEQAGDFPASFAAYEESAHLARAITEETGKGYRPREATERVRRQKAVFTRENLNGRLQQAPAPTSGPTPIFIVGMPRAGSTLVEQILASHSLVEGTIELPLIKQLTIELALSRTLVTPNAYPQCLLKLTKEQLAVHGARFIERARAFRHTDRPFFVDKRPSNWLEAGLIHLILPHAKIIDIRREPMAACFAMYKQILPTEMNFATDLGNLGHYYNNYVSTMDHWRSVLPGCVHFLRYERLVEDTEAEIRRLLEYCGLPFEESCLRFWENDRAVSTPSSEQVRRPIYRGAVEQWRNFEPWLGPLRDSLDLPADV